MSMERSEEFGFYIPCGGPRQCLLTFLGFPTGSHYPAGNNKFGGRSNAIHNVSMGKPPLVRS